MRRLKDIKIAGKKKSIDKTELENLNKKLCVPVTEAQVLEKIFDIMRNPSNYWHLFDKEIWMPPMPELANMV